jgi:hypothetical protein
VDDLVVEIPGELEGRVRGFGMSGRVHASTIG